MRRNFCKNDRVGTKSAKTPNRGVGLRAIRERTLCLPYAKQLCGQNGIRKRKAPLAITSRGLGDSWLHGVLFNSDTDKTSGAHPIPRGSVSYGEMTGRWPYGCLK